MGKELPEMILEELWQIMFLKSQKPVHYRVMI